MKLLQLKYFDMVCRCQNVTKAAETLHVSQPSVSQAIRDLEKEFEIELFTRKHNHMTLTKEGEFFYAHAKEIIEQSDLLSMQMRDFKGKNDVLDLGIAPIIGSMLLPAVYQEMKETIPAISFRITEKNSSSLIEALANDEMDMAISATNQVDPAKFEILPILNIELMFCTNKLNPLSQLRKISPKEVGDEPLVLMNKDAEETMLVLELFKKNGLTPNVVLFSDHLHTIDHFINHAVASSFLYKTIIHRTDDIVVIPLEEPLMIPIGLVWKKNKYLNHASVEFINFINAVTFKYIYSNFKPVRERDNLIPTL